MGYACLVAIMAMGPGYHRQSAVALAARAAAAGGPAPVVTRAGAFLDGLKGLRRVAILTPYMRPLTDLVVHYIHAEAIVVTDSLAREIPDNLKEGRRDPLMQLEDARRLDHGDAHAVVFSACVQMPSLAAIQRLEDELGKPVASAATLTVQRILQALGLERVVPGAGWALHG